MPSLMIALSYIGKESIGMIYTLYLYVIILIISNISIGVFYIWINKQYKTIYIDNMNNYNKNWCNA